MRTIITLSVLLLASITCSIAGNLSNSEVYGFEENKGQIVDQSGCLRPDVRFIYQYNGFKLILRNTGFSYEFIKQVSDNSLLEEAGPKQLSLADEEDVQFPDVKFLVNRIDVEFTSCNQSALINGEGSASFYKNYFNGHTGSSGITNVHCFRKVVYENVYRGIDLVFYFQRNENGRIIPKYEFVIHPGGDINQIRLSYNGMKKLDINGSGVLRTESELGFTEESCPIVLFADGTPSQTGSYILNGNVLSFKKIKRKNEQTIIIDPAIDWGTYYGGNLKDITDELASDSELNLYMTGRTRSYSNIATSGAHQTTIGGADDAVLIKFNSDGDLVWATYHGGDGNDVAFAITTDPFDNIYIGGRTVSSNGIATPGAIIDTFSGGLFDVFLAKFNPSGILQWGTYMGGPLKDEVQGLATNSEGYLYVSGYTESLWGISTPGSYKAVGDTAGESFLMKFSPDGEQIFGTYFGGSKRDRGHGVCAFNGHVYQNGTTNSKDNIATPGAWQDSYTQKLDAFLQEWTEEGELVWSTYFGGEGDDRPRDVKTDDAGNIYFVGQTESETGIATPGAHKTELVYLPKKNRDGYIEKFNPQGFRIWGTYYGGNWIEMARSLRVGRLGAPIWIGGYSKSDSGLITPDAYQTELGGQNDGFLGKFNWDGSELMWSTYYGGKKSESITEGGWYGSSMDVDAAGNVYLSSCTNSPDSIATPGAYKMDLDDTAQYDYFLVKFTDVCSDPFEPNDSLSYVPSIPFNPITNVIHLSAQIQEKEDNDYYSVNVDPGFPGLTIQASALPFDINLFVYDSLQNLIGESQNPGTSDEEIILEGVGAGKIFIQLKSSDASFDNVNCYLITVTESGIPTSDEELAVSQLATIYPNPSSDKATLNIYASASGLCHIEILDLAGRIVNALDRNVVSGENHFTIPTSQLPAGSYMVKVIENEQQQLLKLSVKR